MASSVRDGRDVAGDATLRTFYPRYTPTCLWRKLDRAIVRFSVPSTAFEQHQLILLSSPSNMEPRHDFQQTALTSVRLPLFSLLSLQEFFGSLLEYMCSGPVVAMVWEGTNVIAGGRKVRVYRGDLLIETWRLRPYRNSAPRL